MNKIIFLLVSLLVMVDTTLGLPVCADPDVTPPNAMCMDATVQLDEGGMAMVDPMIFDNGSTDECGITSTVVDVPTVMCSNVGDQVVTVTFEDAASNMADCMPTLTVEDNVDPMALCQDFTAQLDSTGNAVIAVTDIDGGSTDNCGINSLDISPSTVMCADINLAFSTLTVTDVNGNEAVCQSFVTVEDNVAPTAMCQDITVQLDATGTASITAADINNGSSDACGIHSVTSSNNDFGCANIGPNTSTLTVTDTSGNQSTCTANILVEDNIAPTFTVAPFTVELSTSTGTAMVSANEFFNTGPSDNCAVASSTVMENMFTCTDLDDSETTRDFTVTITSTDVNGNSASMMTTLTVDKPLLTNPVIDCNALSITDVVPVTNGLLQVPPCVFLDQSVTNVRLVNCDLEIVLDDEADWVSLINGINVSSSSLVVRLNSNVFDHSVEALLNADESGTLIFTRLNEERRVTFDALTNVNFAQPEPEPEPLPEIP